MTLLRLAAAIAGLCAYAFPIAAHAQTPPPDLVYSRIKPCRAFDTTKTAKIPAASAKSFLISGAGNYAAQGGTTAGCGVPASAQAVSINITAINGAAAGSLTAMAYAQTASAATIRFPVSAPETAIGLVDLLKNKITLRTTNTVNAIGDVTGYWAPPIHAYVDRDGSVTSGARIVNSQKPAAGQYLLTADRNLTGCTLILSPEVSYNNSGGYISQDKIFVFITYLADASFPYVDGRFNVSVIC